MANADTSQIPTAVIKLSRKQLKYLAGPSRFDFFLSRFDLWSALEAAGIALIVAFFAVFWWPSALLIAGLGLILAANLGEKRADPAAAEPEKAAK